MKNIIKSNQIYFLGFGSKPVRRNPKHWRLFTLLLLLQMVNSSICLSVPLSIYPSICLSIYLSKECPLIFTCSLWSRLIEKVDGNSFLTLFRVLLGLRHFPFSSSLPPTLLSRDGSISSRRKLVHTLYLYNSIHLSIFHLHFIYMQGVS